jgi:hypothetical protein
VQARQGPDGVHAAFHGMRHACAARAQPHPIFDLTPIFQIDAFSEIHRRLTPIDLLAGFAALR